MSPADDPASFQNPYRPSLMTILEGRDETSDVRTLRLGFAVRQEEERYGGFVPGQFGEFTVFGEGESVFALAGGLGGRAPGSRREIECTFRAVGKVTTALRGLHEGDVVGFRGPYGNGFPVEEWRGGNLAFLGGGIGMAALRAPIQHVLGHRGDFGEVLILNGARSVGDMVYKSDMDEWGLAPRLRVVRTVDPGGEVPGWDGEVGLIPQVFERVGLAPGEWTVIACGPPVMLRFLFEALGRLGYPKNRVITTLENKMKCGLGKCGRCNVGPFFVCKDGPVITWERLSQLPADL
jgi:sulfhydrogenase subunit gamma (sulfur reductase)